MMTESLSQSLQLRARQMGISAFVFKPGLSKLNPGSSRPTSRPSPSKMMRDDTAAQARERRRPRSGRPEGRAGYPVAAAAAAVAPGEEELSRRVSPFLQRRLAELRQPGDANQIAILVMKVAREFFERGILFLVKNEEARGLGGFGLPRARKA